LGRAEKFNVGIDPATRSADAACSVLLPKETAPPFH
jgi:hypothetical protein